MVPVSAAFSGYLHSTGQSISSIRLCADVEKDRNIVLAGLTVLRLPFRLSQQTGEVHPAGIASFHYYRNNGLAGSCPKFRISEEIQGLAQRQLGLVLDNKYDSGAGLNFHILKEIAC